ncbi:MAG: FAD-binding oxidoreductase [Chloroflexi bacterium]|nr:FAD-binding oxidoreductase [Chloroflexota bacterium]
MSAATEAGVQPSLAPLADALGAACREPSPDELAALAIHGIRPRLVCVPQSVAEVSAALRVAGAAGLAIIPAGGLTQLGLGAPPRRSDVLLDLRALAAVVEYAPEDLTATVQAGMRLVDLRRLLAERGQFLPLNPPLPDDATVGGILATNAHGSWRARYGALRDLLIGSRVVHGDGLVSHSGGKVVKNVAGYDLNKAWVGSLGTLGVVVEATFKLQPLPAARGWSEAAFADVAAAVGAAGRLARAPLPYLGAELLTPRAAAAVGLAAEHLLVVEWGGPAAAVARCQREWPALAHAAEARRAGDRQAAPPTATWGSADEVVLRASLPLGHVVPLLAELESQWPAAGAVAQALTGTIRAAGPLELGPGAPLVRHLRGFATALGGWLVVERAPLALKEQVDVWGPPAGPLELMRRLKQAFDPAGIMNHGRFVGGL